MDRPLSIPLPDTVPLLRPDLILQPFPSDKEDMYGFDCHLSKWVGPKVQQHGSIVAAAQGHASVPQGQEIKGQAHV